MNQNAQSHVFSTSNGDSPERHQKRVCFAQPRHAQNEIVIRQHRTQSEKHKFPSDARPAGAHRRGEGHNRHNKRARHQNQTDDETTGRLVVRPTAGRALFPWAVFRAIAVLPGGSCSTRDRKYVWAIHPQSQSRPRATTTKARNRQTNSRLRTARHRLGAAPLRETGRAVTSARQNCATRRFGAARRKLAHCVMLSLVLCL